jgi:hypothetical protein
MQFPVIAKNKTGKIKGQGKNGTYEYEYKYADLPSILEAITPILSEHNLVLTQHTKIDGSLLTLVTRVTHISGDQIEGEYPVCSTSGEHQKMGSALTYSRRYGLSSLLSISVDEDVDGQGAATVNPNEQRQKTDQRTALQKANDLVDWLPGCRSMSLFQEAEAKAKAELKEPLGEAEWLRLEAELNATFGRLDSELKSTQEAAE